MLCFVLFCSVLFVFDCFGFLDFAARPVHFVFLVGFLASLFVCLHLVPCRAVFIVKCFRDDRWQLPGAEKTMQPSNIPFHDILSLGMFSFSVVPRNLSNLMGRWALMGRDLKVQELLRVAGKCNVNPGLINPLPPLPTPEGPEGFQ